MNNILHPLVGTFRTLFRKPGFAVAVIVILALGIGINVATLGLLYRYYVSPLPYAQGSRIVSVYLTSKLPGAAAMQAMDLPTWQGLRKGAPALADSGVYTEQGYNLTLGNRQSRLNGIEASASVFSTLGVRPVLGRAFGPDSTKPGAAPVVVLSYRLWQSLFGGRSSAIGKTIRLNGKAYSVIGVMPSGFDFPTSQTALWTPLEFGPEASNPFNLTELNVTMVGRLAEGASLKTFLTQANVILNGEIAHFPMARARSLLEKLGMHIEAQSWRASRLGHLHQSLVLVSCATALLMLLVWFNLANLSLSRAYARRSELAMRRVLGAKPWAVTLSLAREHLILSLLGAVGGVILGRFLLDLFSGSSVAVGASAIGAASWPALIVIALVLALISTVIFTSVCLGLLRGSDLSGALRDAGAHVSSGHSAKRLRLGLITGQIALACAIAGSGLFLGRSLLNLNAIRLGFKPDHVVTFELSFPASQYSMAQVSAGIKALRSATTRLPGASTVSVSSSVPFNGSSGGSGVFPRPWVPANHPQLPLAFAVLTGSGHLKTFGMSILAGRNFLPSDTPQTASVAIIDTLAARQLFGTENVIGREFSFRSPKRDKPGELFRVIGIVPSVRRENVGASSSVGNVYLRFNQVMAQSPDWANRDWYLAVRSPLPAAVVISEVRTTARRVIPGVPLYDVQTMNQRVGDSLASNRLITALVLLFAVGAVVLAAIGLYAVQAYAVAQRAREFAIRAAIGANRGRLLAMVLGETARLLVIGLVVGLAGLAAIGVAFATAFYGIGAVDPLSMMIVAVVLALAALAASWIPAWRASRIEPAQALKQE